MLRPLTLQLCEWLVWVSAQWPFDVRGLKTPPSDHAKRLHFEHADACILAAPVQNDDYRAFLYFSICSPCSLHPRLPCCYILYHINTPYLAGKPSFLPQTSASWYLSLLRGAEWAWFGHNAPIIQRQKEPDTCPIWWRSVKGRQVRGHHGLSWGLGGVYLGKSHKCLRVMSRWMGVSGGVEFNSTHGESIMTER